MKRFWLIPYIICLALLTGCGGGLSASRRDMEHLRPIQAISLDRAGDGVVLGVSSGIGPSGSAPLVMKGEGSSIEAAIATLQSYSPEDELFYAHVQYILLGETMANRGILPLLDWVERSPAMRMDSALLLVTGSAADALTDATGETTDITERLFSLEREEKARGQHIYTLREAAASLLERGSALCLVIGSAPSEGVIFTKTEASAAVVPLGYAVLRDGEEAVFLTAEETMGAQLIEGRVTGGRAVVDGAVLELFSDGAEVTGLRDETGALRGLFVRCRLRAGILERPEGADAAVAQLEDDLSAAAEGWLAAAVERSQALGCDFLDLEGSVRPADADGFAAVFSGLPVTVRVDGRIDRSYDLTEGGR